MDDIKATLEAKEKELEAELERLTAPPDEPSGISFGKRVGEGTSMAIDRLVDVELHDQIQAQLGDVRRTLAKLEQGTYGSCDTCGAAIPAERLEFRPWAVLCVHCASG